MDVARSKSVKRNRRIRQIIYGVIALLVICGATVGLARLKPAAPSVDGGTLWRGEVKRGEMLREVRGIGTLVPEEIRWIPATTDGRVEKRLVKPGATVTPDTIIIELSNPIVERDAVDAATQLKAAEAELENQKVQVQSQRLNQQAQAATVRADFQQAKIQAEAYETLSKEGLYSDLQTKQARSRAEELATRDRIEQERLAMGVEAMKSQISVYQARVDQLRALYDLRRRQLDSLKVRAGQNGVLQELPVQVGQQVTAGTNLARVADPLRLKAEVKIAETQAKDIVVGQPAKIDTRNGIVAGRVTRIDPSVQQGTVTVDVSLDEELPKGARPDLSVDGTIELERLDNVLFV
ncbi:MAG TPA: HlyD family efflux transporter periplasmic adaptor subunit, partial [Blastocatellia bacterium]|nr:HlyD family efflux transporter periplasmic adaptor subunit [Blastocatellia bacterium]